MKFHSLIFSIIFTFLLLPDAVITAQTLTDGPIQLQVRVREINTTFSGPSDGAIAGVGFLPDEYTYKVWIRDNADLDGAGWLGGNCMTTDFNPPGLSNDFNLILFNHTYTTPNVPQFFDVRLDAWEDDLPSDGALGICTNNRSRCDFDCCNICCGFGLFGACVGVREEDDRRCDANPFRTQMNYRLGPPCQWYNHGYVTGGSGADCAGYRPRIESYWRYTRGDNCNNPLVLGALNPGGTLSHFNSNECYNNNYGNPGRDVFYRFTINQAMGVRISLCGGATWNTSLFLLNANCTNLLYSNNNSPTCAPQSLILENICTPGDYIVVVDGWTNAEQGVFTLTISEDPSIGMNVNVTSTNITCNGLTNGTATAGVSGGTAPYTYLWTPGNMTTASVSGLNIGTYNVRVRDAQSCEVNRTITITQPATLQLTPTVVHPVCNGGSTGRINVALAQGGTTPYEYSIGGSYQSGTLFTNLIAGAYDVTIRDVNQCTAVTSVTLTDPPRINGNLTSTPVSCAGFNDGTVTANPSNGTAPYQCALNFPPVFAPCVTYTGLSSGSHVVTIRDANGCEVIEPVNISVVPALTINLFSKTDVSCYGGNDGSFELVTSGGTPPYEFSINGGVNYQPNPVINNLTANVYTVLVRDMNGCSNSLNVTINQPPVLIPSVLFQIQISCNGLSDGFIVITASGGTGPYEYSFDNVNFYQSGAFDNMPGGNFQFIVRDNNGCEATLNASTIEPPPLSVSVTNLTNASCNGVNDGAVTLQGAGGTPPFKYSLNNGPFQTNPIFSNLAPGNYLVGVEDKNSCLAFDSMVIGANVFVAANVTFTDVLCKGDNSGSIIITGSGGTAPYDYSINNITFQSSENFNNLAAGTYSAIARDVNGCRVVEVVEISEPVALSASILNITHAGCPGIPDGGIEISVQGGTGNYTFNWQHGANTQNLQNVPGGTYTVTITDDNQCSTTLSATVNQPNAAFTDITRIDNVKCFGSSDGYVDLDIVGGVPPFQYLWSNQSTNQDLLNVPAGHYTVTVTDAAGCLVIDSATVSEPDTMTTVITATPVSCSTSADANIQLTVTGGTPPYNFLWSNFVFTQNQTNVPAGTYTVLITDKNGCLQMDAITIIPAPGLNATLTVKDISCHNDNNGEVEVVVNGGTPPYNYNWSNNLTGSSVTNLIPGIYSVTITDAVGCSGVHSALITEPLELNLTVSASSVLCHGDNTGIAIPFVTGGTGAYTYHWSINTPNNVTNNSPALINVRGATYYLEVRDENNCSVMETVVIGQPDELSVELSTASGVTCASGDDGEALFIASGGVPPYQYSVRTNIFQNDNAFTGLRAGDYGVLVIDANGCMTTNQFTIVDAEGFTVDLPPYLFISLGASDTLKAVVLSDNPVFSYEWLPADFLNCSDCPRPLVTPLYDMTYTLVVTDVNGCAASDEILVVVKDEYEIYVPNAFSPNGDGLNDIFQPIDFGGTRNAVMQIFNRWGAKVFETNNIRSGWDGTFNGKLANSGVFVYRITGEFLDGTPFDRTGSVTLFR